MSTPIREQRSVRLSSLRNFFAKFDIAPSGCWEWNGPASGSGYGSFGDRTVMSTTAHRVAYEWFVGPIADNFQVDHLCRNRLCVNPSHLEAVTASENIQRAVAARGPYCRNGHLQTPENSRFWQTGRGKTGRYCLTCRAESRRKVGSHAA